MLDRSIQYELMSGESWRDPYPMYRSLRDHDPVHYVEGDSHRDGFWLLSRFDDVFDAARDTGVFSSSSGLTVERGTGVDMGEASPIVFLDPPDHTAFRRLVSSGFTPRQVSTIERAVRSFVAERLEGLGDAGGGDIVTELFKPLPSFVVAHYLGVPLEDRCRFDRWTDQIVAAAAQGQTDDPESGIAELLEYFTDLIQRRRIEPGGDMISQLISMGEATVPVLWILGFAFTMVTGGNDTTTGLLGGSTALLYHDPAQRRRLAENPEMIPSAVEELLRLTSPVQNLARTTTQNVELHGTTIPKGSKVLLGYGAANRDEREFGKSAELLEVGRNPSRILTFGYGAHHCLGAAVARLQGRVVLEELLSRFPDYVVDPDRMEYATGNYVRRPLNLAFSPS
ncbi:MAG: cytochrome P450 [Acidimicrobiales bacterium]|nr:cytochrome P450 [Acidimicrobiales bacterium]